MRTFAIAMLMTATAFAYGDSLYQPAGSGASLYSDRRATGIGDVLHIVVTENASAAQTMSDNTSVSSEANIGPGLGKLSFLPLWGYAGDTSAKASGGTSRSDTLTARLAVTVVGRAPNGNLLVEGEREVQVHADHQTLKISGEVRPRDVAPDNSVPSYKVANVRISYDGSSPQKPGSKVGFITRLLHLLF